MSRTPLDGRTRKDQHRVLWALAARLREALATPGRQTPEVNTLLTDLLALVEGLTK